jgi:hypothetical protein
LRSAHSSCGRAIQPERSKTVVAPQFWGLDRSDSDRGMALGALEEPSAFVGTNPVLIRVLTAFGDSRSAVRAFFGRVVQSADHTLRGRQEMGGAGILSGAGPRLGTGSRHRSRSRRRRPDCRNGRRFSRQPCRCGAALHDAWLATSEGMGTRSTDSRPASRVRFEIYGGHPGTHFTLAPRSIRFRVPAICPASTLERRRGGGQVQAPSTGKTGRSASE